MGFSDDATTRGPGGIRVTILAGQPRSGKSTVLNALLAQTPAARTAIVGKTLAANVHDLVQVLLQLRREREDGSASFERVVVECDGADNPARTALALFIDETVAGYYMLDAIVTVVDALHGLKQLAAHDVALEQVAFADRLVLAKGDLVSHGQQQVLMQRLHALNPRAPLQLATEGLVDSSALFDTGAFDLATMLALEPRFFSLPVAPRPAATSWPVRSALPSRTSEIRLHHPPLYN